VLDDHHRLNALRRGEISARRDLRDCFLTPRGRGIEANTLSFRNSTPGKLGHQDIVVREFRREPALRLAEKVTVVTGAGRGIGRAVAESFAREGASVVLVDVIGKAAQKACDAIDKDGRSSAVACDISDSEQVSRLFAVVEQRYGRLDVLVNVAGIPGGGKPLSALDDDTWHRMIAVNLTGTFFCTRAAAGMMLEQRRAGSIITVSSTGALSGESAVHYDTAKGALLSMTRSLARELGGKGIRVNAICPGPTNTELLSALGEQQIQALARRIPLKRIGEPQDIAGAALFLASDEATFITGQTLMVNGGSWFL
jgi:3-oxoacyl-[acyl-carrier protein] reductase